MARIGRARAALWPRLGVVIGALVASIVVPGSATAGPVGVDPDGLWGPVEPWPLVAIHAALMPDGSVVTYGTNQDGQQTGRFVYDVWDSSGSAGSGHSTLPNTTPTDLFCNIQLVRPESGKLVMFGGDNWTGTGTTNTGNPDIVAYDPATQTLASLSPMLRPRWYATAITMPDGSVYIQGGLDGNDIAEHWSESTGSVELPFDPSSLDYFYPRNFVLSDGRVFGFDIEGYMYFLDSDLQTLTNAGRLAPANRGAGSSAVMYEPGKILQIGGKSSQAVIIDVTGSTPTVTPTAPLSSHRNWVDATLLPDGRVLATGGSAVHQQLTGVNNFAEIWDPATGQWTIGAEGAVARLYHSTTLLLPDGRVLVAGGGAPGPLRNLNAEIYSPDYLVAADGSPMPRPTITAVSATSTIPGADVVVTVEDASDIDRVTLLKTGSVTHSFNFEQRLVETSFAVNDDDLTVELPLNPAEITPGHYLLTVIDEDGIPSASEIIQVEPLPVPTITLDSASVQETDSGETAVVSVPVTLSNAYHDEVTVAVNTLDVPGNPSLASSADGDYQSSSTTVTIPAGETQAFVDVTVTGDDRDEQNEWIVLALSNATNARIGGFWGLGFGGIVDDDAPPVISPAWIPFAEGDAPATVQLPFDLSAPSGKTVTVNWSTIDIPSNPALASSSNGDFTAASGTLTFPPGVTRQHATINIRADTAPEGDEYLVVVPSAPANATIGGFFGLGVVLIADDDPAPGAGP